MSVISDNLAAEVRNARGKHLVLFLDGSSSWCDVFVYRGPALVGEPTAYVIKDDGSSVWVKPGESVSFVESVLKGN